MKDENIVELFLQRDQTAIDRSQEKYERYLFKVAQNILADEEDVRECLNDTYLAAWNSIPPNNPDVLQTYLVKLVRRIAIDRYRSQNRLKRKASEYALSLDELAECLPSQATIEAQFDASQLNGAINSFLLGLSEQERHLFIGRYYFLDPVKRVAQYCNMGAPKAKSMLYRIRLRLKAYLTEEGFNL